MRLRIGTRGSALALAQAGDVARRLEALGHATETIIITTAGDRMTDRAFAEVGAFGIFVREIEAALIDRRVDVAVHSYRDLPSAGPPGLMVAAVPERVDAADVLLIRAGAMDDRSAPIPLRDGARDGTSAARRTAQLRAAHAHLEIAPLRGNVPTRVRSLAEGRNDAIVVAAAGLLRLERGEGGDGPIVPAGVVRRRLDPAYFVPAPAQGAIAVQVRAEDLPVRHAVAALDDGVSARPLRAERAALALAEGGCSLPFGAWCRGAARGSLCLTVALGQSDGTIARAELTGDDPDALAAAAWRAIAAEALR